MGSHSKTSSIRKYDGDGNLTEKKCSKCKTFKSIDNYQKNQSSVKDGLSGWCMVCFKENQYEKRRLVGKESNEEVYLRKRRFDVDGKLYEKQCSKCKIFLSVDNYFTDKSMKYDGLYNNCKKCHRIKNKIQYEKKIDKK